MKIGYLVSEYFGYRISDGSCDEIIPTNNHGGFGYLAKVKAETLVKMGHEVHVFVPSYTRLPEDEARDGLRVENGVTIHNYFVPYEVDRRVSKLIWNSFSTGMRNQAPNRLDALLATRDYQFDIFHSEEPLDYTLIAMKYNTNHVIVFQDPYDDADIELLKESRRQFRRFGDINLRLIENDFIINRAYENMKRTYRNTVSKVLKKSKPNSVFAEAHFISEKTMKLFNLNYKPSVLPNPINMPPTIPKKSERPIILWIGRWDPVKRVQLALDVASKLKSYEFYFIGVPTKNRFIQAVYQNLSARFSKFSNIHILGFITEEQKELLLDQAWILINTSFREGLPITFLEAAAHGLSILSTVNPDGWADKFGKFITQESAFTTSLKEFVEDEEFRTFGKKAFEYVRNVHDIQKVMAKHVEIYNEIITNQTT